MEAEKIRNTTDAELKHQEHDLGDQLFRLKFQMKMGQTESLQKMRGLRRDIARIKTIMRERELGVVHSGVPAKSAAPPQPVPAEGKKAAARPAAVSAAKKSAKKMEKK